MRLTNPAHPANLERLESRLLFNVPPQKFLLPVEGTPGVDWAVTAYPDRDPRPGVAADYRGRGYTFDGNDSTHFALADFAAMDAGFDAYAVAGGTVVDVHDGEYDRHLVLADPLPKDNYVLIDHGGGWRTRYGRLRNGSVAVSPGQAVTAGQKIGQVGGSGNFTPNYAQSNAFLDFEVAHDGVLVDPFMDQNQFWHSPPPFAGDAPGVFYMATSDTLPTNDAVDGFKVDEHISARRVFHPGELVYTLAPWHGRNRGAVMQFRFYRPDGTTLTDTGNTTPDDRAMGWRSHRLSLAHNVQLGVWQVAAELNGRELGRTSFIVAPPSEGLPEIEVYQEDTYVIDGRTTPLDFGQVDSGGGAIRRSFWIYNYGTQPLTLGQLTLPEGFSVSGEMPASILPDEFAELVLQLDDQRPGAKAGRVVIRSNDADQREFDFAVTGSVTGVPAAVDRVFVGSSGWSDAFLAHLHAQGIGSSAYGFDLPPPGRGGVGGAAAEPAQPLPWPNLDRITLRFNGDQIVNQSDLAIRGVGGAAYGISSFAYDQHKKTATWTLRRSLGIDRVTLTLGAGSPQTFEVNVLPGDVNRNATVLAEDFSAVKRKFFSSTVNPGSGDAAYSVFHDIDGSGSILANDFSAVKQRFFDRLPDAAPAASVPATGSALPVASPVTAEVLRSEKGMI